MEDEEELIECEYCHRQVKKSQTKTAYFYRENISGYVAGEVCEECIQEFFAECANCGNLTEKSTMAGTDNGLVCEACLTDDYATCSICGKLHRTDDMTWVDFEGEYVCNDCFDEHYIYCHDCGEIEHRNNAYWVESLNDYICERCYQNNYVTCENCGKIVYFEDAYQNDYGDWFCENCWEEEEMDDEEILGYHGNHGQWTPYKTAEDVENPMYFGFELEIDHKEESRRNQHEAVMLLKEGMNCYLEHDGSLNEGGFEIVSQPQTYKYILENYDNYKNIFERLVELGYISHNSENCGLHFHVTAPSEETREDIVSRLWLIIENYKEQFEKISRRHNNFHWCHFLSENNPKSSLSGLYKMKGVEKNGSRYLVINNTNSKTIEIRLFKGTLNIDTFFANLQLVYNLFTLAYDLDTKIEDITWAKLIKGQYIAQYCKENKIHSQKKIKDNSLKYITLENRIDKVAQKIYNDCYKTTLKYNKEFSKETAEAKDLNRDFIIKFGNTVDVYNTLLNTLYRLGEKVKRKNYFQNFYSQDFLDNTDDILRYFTQLNITVTNSEKLKENIRKFKLYREKIRG